MLDSSKRYLSRKRDIILLTLVLSLVLNAAGYIYYRYEANTIRSEKHSELKAIAELKTNQITDWYKDEEDDAEIISRNPTLVPAIKKWLDFKGESSKQNILQQLEALKEEHGYENILFADKYGKFLLSLEPNIKQIDSTIEACVKKSVAGNKVICTDLFINKIDGKNQLSFVSPITDERLGIIAVLVVDINPDAYLYPLIQTWPTASKSAETILVRKFGNKVLFLNELRHGKNTALKLSIDLSRKEVPAVQVVLGYRGIFEGRDYRGIEVLSDVRPVPGTPWFMIAKVDRKEIFSELYFRTGVIIIVILLLITLFGIGLAWIYHYRQRNIYKELYIKKKELWESQEEFRTTLYSIGDGVITTDTNGNIKQMNHEAERLTGWNETDAKGKNLEVVFVIINEETRKKVTNPAEKVLKEGVVVGLANHTLLVSKDGKEIPIADSGAPIKSESGGVTGVVLVFKDQTKEYTAQRALEESEERLRLALQAANQGIYDLNTQTGEAKVTPEYAKMLGYEPEEFVETNERWIKRLHPDDTERVGKVYQDYIAGKIPEYRVEFRQRTKTGDWKWILSLGKILEVDSKGNPVRMLGTHTDITERKKIEQDLIEAKEWAENSEKLKSEFLAQMSHEIRSPINVILSYVDLIQNNLSEKIDKELLPGFDSIAFAGRRIIRTIDLILNMSDLQLGTYDLNNKEFDIVILLRSLLREYLKPALDKNIKINLEVRASQNNVVSDEYAVNQIFANLLDNAVKYTDEGKISIDISNDKQGKIVVKVSDSGIGISEDYLPVLFTPFSQEEQGYSRKFDGNGLGLSLVKKYCDLLGADISVESVKNKGTTFTVVLPINNNS